MSSTESLQSFSSVWDNRSMWSNRSCPLEEEALRLPLAVLYSLIFLFGLLGNLLALWVFLFLHRRRNSVRVFLINVALADLVLLACLPFRVLYHALGNVWTLGPRMCRVVGNLFYMNMYVSITLLGLISLDRYLKIMGSHRGRRWLRGRSWSLVTCGLLWGLSVLMAVPMMALAEGNEEPGKCYQYKQRKHARGKAYFNLVMVAVFWLVFVVLLVSYGQIARRLLRASQDKPHLPNAARYARTARKSFVVPLLFTVCFVPYHAFRGFYVASQLQDISCETRRLMDRTNEAVLLLSALNSCLDPVMYFLLSGSVRRATLQALAQCLRLHAEPPATNSSTTELRRTSVSHASTTAVLDTSRCSLGNITTLRSQHTDLHPHSEPCVHRSGLSD
ncbi:probable G-protein coupled receptor 34a [Danio rerio]|uniref:Probable G-protein coupled receptor 34 n=1 Tax=Danio rerio TaxID=7955 RepID=Q6XCC7_DANRE|nr:probable G-protein coupled receptor 34a [Danio rerio]AAP04313.1 G-protein-coupled receptor GPR34 type 1 [Danio rerio]|eukprot:NP_001007216.1 G protein-coupled receptor 34a [Danio rerio]